MRRRVPAPAELSALLPASAASLRAVDDGRREIRDVVDGRDGRLLLVVGPCSIHDPKAALEYAGRLKGLAARVADRFVVAMRAYFEKPRTSVGWDGLINDPRMDGSSDVAEGLRLARRLLLEITRLGVRTAAEALDPIATQYLAGLVCWHAIGARTVESQTHRKLASGLPTPVGFKNGTDGGVQAAVDAVLCARQPHRYLGADASGRVAVLRTGGNPHGHVVLRGGRRPNFDGESLARCRRALAAAGLRPAIMVDCSHGNSGKDPTRQPAVFRACLERRLGGDRSLIGMMLESNLRGGNQPMRRGPGGLKYGVSVTDKCLGWEDTEELILDSYAAIARHAAPLSRRPG